METTKEELNVFDYVANETSPEASHDVPEYQSHAEPASRPIAREAHCPRSWPRRRKWTATLILSALAFLQPLSETMLAPAEQQVSQDLHISQPFEWFLVNSLILIGVGLAPLLLAPLSEIYGRKPVLIISSIVFVSWNTGCGAASTLGEMLAFRLLSGFGACVGDALAGGVISDIWCPEERGRAFAIFMAAPLLGPAVGPICGAFISEKTSWRWVFWIISSASAVVIIVGIMFMPETYEPRLKQLQEDRSHRRCGSMLNLRWSPEKIRPFLGHLLQGLQRPLRMLATQVIVQLLAAYMAVLYGTMFLFLFIYPTLWQEKYHEATDIGSLNYISFAAGLVIGVNIAGHLNDYTYAVLKARNHGIGQPEFRVPPMVIGTILVPVGLIWWGWSGEAQLHWIMPNIGSLIFAMGVYICSGCVSIYTIDAYSQYAASAISTNLVLRSLTAAFFPLFAPYLFGELGFGIGATVLASAFTVVGSVVVVILWFFGAKLRSHSPYCANAVGDV